MIIDFHVHSFPKNIRNNREKYFSGEPEFKLLYKSSKNKMVGTSEIINIMNKQEILMSVVFGFPWHNYKTCRENNDYIIEMVQKYPKRFKGFCCVDPFDSKALVEVKRCLNLGLSGVGELAFYKRAINNETISVLKPIMNICRKYDAPVMLHTNEEVGHLYPGKTSNTIGQIYKLIKNFPHNKIVLAHWGGGIFFFNLLKKEAPEILKNTYYDIAASPFLYNKKIYSVAKKLIGTNKFIFGTDYPLIEPIIYLNEMKNVGLDELDMHKICFENAAKLLKI